MDVSVWPWEQKAEQIIQDTDLSQTKKKKRKNKLKFKAMVMMFLTNNLFSKGKLSIMHFTLKFYNVSGK
jgi:hypothetical protein